MPNNNKLESLVPDLSAEAKAAILSGFEGCVKTWSFDGAGSARYGWVYLHPCKKEWLGRTKGAAIARAK